jgi:hypothetical protein
LSSTTAIEPQKHNNKNPMTLFLYTLNRFGLPQSLKLSYNYFNVGMAESKKRTDDNKKLTKVLYTKLSIEDYNLFRVLTNIAYQYKAINQDKPSEMLRFLVTPVVDGLRKQPGFSLLQSSLRSELPELSRPL